MYVVFNNVPSDSKFTTEYLRQILLLNNLRQRGNALKFLHVCEVIIFLGRFIIGG